MSKRRPLYSDKMPDIKNKNKNYKNKQYEAEKIVCDEPNNGGSDSESFEADESFCDEPDHGDNNKKCIQHNTTEKITNRPHKEKNYESDSQPSKLLNIYICILAITIMGVLALCMVNTKTKKKCDFTELHSREPIQSSDTWDTLLTSVELVLNKTEYAPSVNLLTYSGKSKVKDLINDIADHTSKCFGNKVIHMNQDDFTSSKAVKDYGYVIEQCKDKLKEGNVLVLNLNEIPGEVAPALHSICDTHNPISKDIVIFLTLITKHQNVSNPTKDAMNILNDLWSAKLITTELDPLITRIVDNVVPLKD